MRAINVGAIWWLSIGCAQAAEPPAPATTPPPVVEVSPGIFKTGEITFSKEARTVRFPALVNMEKGLLEYFLVGPQGATHESMFTTAVEPTQVHLAMLLIGAKDAPNDSATGPAGPINLEYLKSAPQPTGDEVFITVTWEMEGKKIETDAADVLWNRKTGAPMTPGPWIYNGSRVSNGIFLAQTGHCFVALVTNPAALINNPRPERIDDQAWTVNPAKAPPLKTPVEICFTLGKKTD